MNDQEREELRAHLYSVVDEAVKGDALQVDNSRGSREVECQDHGCGGCGWVHRELTDKRELHLTWDRSAS